MQNEYMYQLLTKMKDGDQQAFHAMYDATYQDIPDSLLYWWIISRIGKMS